MYVPEEPETAQGPAMKVIALDDLFNFHWTLIAGFDSYGRCTCLNGAHQSQSHESKVNEVVQYSICQGDMSMSFIIIVPCLTLHHDDDGETPRHIIEIAPAQPGFEAVNGLSQ